ncbi:heparinase II/III family protein [Microbacterium sp.]|uniref:heparinase II/III family protein n=1 Tax=Microbacterium sp. TaxID=51671 RepID=UPI0028122B00|nr:heparinase II/III family protein [Microbacterium sp.]
MLVRRGALRDLWLRSGDAGRALPAPTASDREAWNRVGEEQRALVLAEADAARGRPWPQPLLSQWADYGRSGDRTAYEAAVFTRNRRIRLAALAAALDPSPARLAEAADGLWLKCEQSTWCWPAHDDAFGRGLMVPDADRPFVDLGAGEDVALAAWSVQVIGGALREFSPGLVERLGAEARERVLLPFVRRRDWTWEGTESHVHNWAPWIHGNLLPAAVVFAERDLRDEVIALCVDGLDRYLAQLPADGGIDEGFGYWWQGAARAFDALGLLDALTDGAIRDAVRGGELSGLGELVRFPQRMQFGPGWFASFSDASAAEEPDLPWHSLFRAAQLCGADDAAAFARVSRRSALGGLDAGVAAGLGRMIPELLDPTWGVGIEGPDRILPARVWLPSLSLGIRRETAGSTRGLTVLAKGGTNDENHNHNDLGSFQVAVDGIPLLADLGRATYTAQTFSDRRYELWYVRSDWHSTPMPNGVVQHAGADWRAAVAELPDGWKIDLAHAYPRLDAPWTRTVRLTGGSVIVADESPALRHPTTRIVVVCAGVPEPHDGVLLVPGREGSRSLLLTHDPASVEIETRDVDDPYLRRSWGERVSRMLFGPASGDRWELRGSAL